MDAELTALAEKYLLKHPHAKLRAATKALVVTISALNECNMANPNLVKKIAMIIKNGLQQPGIATLRELLDNFQTINSNVKTACNML
ncbi:MAG: hypothetical protein Q7R66_16845 [Undibacterium sp.]|uniref:hypothetical protein n=1 Tax=Undibacterium sp. TaxID=1914977 RepID=UPI00272219FA|nr:hypothetical protein [Undibacterium sp.]MDO8653847.1 hypothetical protein [Undibacterium sp.]